MVEEALKSIVGEGDQVIEAEAKSHEEDEDEDPDVLELLKSDIGAEMSSAIATWINVENPASTVTAYF